MSSSAKTLGRPFIKMHGLHNEFVIVDARAIPYKPTLAEIVRVCDANDGIGADELIVMEPSSRADVFMRIYNGDGREVEACGNATRCVAWLLLEEDGSKAVVVETLAGLLACRRAGERMVSVDMGIVSVDALHLDVGHGVLADPVTLRIGNPHAVFFVDDVRAVDVREEAPAIQRDAHFPDQVNVGVAQMLPPDRMRLIVYERGAGLTMACGSGACAAAVAARKRGLTDSRRIDIELPGGVVRIDVAGDDSVTMTGPVEESFRGTLPA
jgi:diaminopimelate epimerase